MSDLHIFIFSLLQTLSKWVTYTFWGLLFRRLVMVAKSFCTLSGGGRDSQSVLWFRANPINFITSFCRHDSIIYCHWLLVQVISWQWLLAVLQRRCRHCSGVQLSEPAITAVESDSDSENARTKDIALLQPRPELDQSLMAVFTD